MTRTPGRLIRALCEIREPSCLSQRALSMVSERADALRRSLATRAASTRLSGGRQGPAGLHTRLVLVLALLVFAVLAATSSALACVVGTGTSASCTEAALNACLPGGGSFDSSVNFNCGGAATITLTSGKGISADTSIDGGSLITISGYGFGVDTGVTFTVENLTMANCPAGAIGNGGTLTVTNCTFLANSADYGDGGGAIFNSNEDGTVVVATLTVTNSTFSGNSGLSGGAILSIGGTLTVTNCTFLANSADGDGGGAIFNSNTVLEDGTVVVATLTVTNSTFSGNSASSSGLGGFGGAIRNGGTLTVTDSVFCGNSAPAAGLSTTPAAR